MSPAEPRLAQRTPDFVIEEPLGEELVHRAAAPRPDGQQRPAGQERPDLRLVRQQAQRRTNRRHLVVPAGIAVAAGVLMALVALHVLIAENQFRLDNLAQRAAAQQATYEKLRLSVAELESPSRIVSVAEGKLGMQQPGTVTYLPATSTPTAGTAAGPSASADFGDTDTGSSASAPSGDADWPSIKPFLSGSP